MDTQLTSNAEALRLFFTEDIYLVTEKEPMVDVDALGPLSTKKEAIENIAIAPEKAKTMFKFLGKNQKNILILVNDLENEVSTEQG
ncbi:MAG: hypothetical protein KAY27_01190, partial [Pedobacter sp.]|nr:hypothetical protein [Pedobacter sp.]